MLLAVKFRDQKRTHCEYLKENSFLRVVPREYLNDESFLRVYLAARGAISSVEVSLVLDSLGFIISTGGAAATNSRSCRWMTWLPFWRLLSIGEENGFVGLKQYAFASYMKCANWIYEINNSFSYFYMSMINKSYFSLWKRVGPSPDFVVRSKLILESGGG